MTSAVSPSRNGSTVGTVFADALARRDFQGVGELLHPEIDFRALTPGRAWEAAGPDEALEVFRTWFGNADVEQVVRLDTDAFADRQRVAYRFSGRRPDGPFLIEQQVFYSERDGQIDWMRILCSGYRARA